MIVRCKFDANILLVSTGSRQRYPNEQQFEGSAFQLNGPTHDQHHLSKAPGSHLPSHLSYVCYSRQAGLECS